MWILLRNFSTMHLWRSNCKEQEIAIPILKLLILIFSNVVNTQILMFNFLMSLFLILSKNNLILMNFSGT